MLYINKPVKTFPAVHLSPKGEIGAQHEKFVPQGQLSSLPPPEKDLFI
jgi:hypothetical protein